MAVKTDHTAQGGTWNQDWCRWEWHDDQARLHRVDGPAVIYPDDTCKWCLHQRDVTTEVEAWMRANHITWPFAREQQAEFVLRWG